MAAGKQADKEWVEKQLKKYGMNFDALDTDKSGSLRFREVVKSLIKGGFRGSYADAKKVFTQFEKDSDKRISRSEYLKTMKEIPIKQQKGMAMRREFKIIDTKNSGSLTREEMLDAIRNAELNPEADEISNLLTSLDEDEDGMLNYEQFLKTWRR